MIPILVVRIARPTSLAIWHRGCSHMISQAKPQRESESQPFRIARSKKTPRFFASQANIAGFSRALFLAFSCDFRSSECIFALPAKKKLFRIASDLGMCDSNPIWGCAIRIASHIAVASRDPNLRSQSKGMNAHLDFKGTR